MNRKKSSFEVIFRHLRTGPPSLTAVQEFFYNAEALTQFVALQDAVKISTLKIRNRSNATRRLAVASYT